MSSKNLLQLARELQEGAAEQEALLLQLRYHPKRNAHAQAVLTNYLMNESDEMLCQTLETSIKRLSTQRVLLQQTLYMLGPVNVGEGPILLN
jgi:hypothetical protein